MPWPFVGIVGLEEERFGATALRDKAVAAPGAAIERSDGEITAPVFQFPHGILQHRFTVLCIGRGVVSDCTRR